MRRILPIVALVLAYAMTPGALELTENALHLLTHGDSAHADADHADDTDSDEHGCSGTYHACTCHTSPQFLDSSAAPILVSPTVMAQVGMTGPAAMVGSGFMLDIDRPPQA